MPKIMNQKNGQSRVYHLCITYLYTRLPKKVLTSSSFELLFFSLDGGLLDGFVRTRGLVVTGLGIGEVGPSEKIVKYIKYGLLQIYTTSMHRSISK